MTLLERLCKPPRRGPHWRDARQASEVGRRRKAESALPPRVAGRSADELLAWYERHARRLPWRVGPKERRLGVRPDPYRVWLSEIMLQQTTVKAVAPYFQRFVTRWPTRRRNSPRPSDNDVMAAWAGLGYYSRARNLIACARASSRRGRARAFPKPPQSSPRLPGIGAYTSAAIAAIAFDEPVAVVDGNVERVVARALRHRHAAAGRQAAHPRQAAAARPARPRRRVRRGADGSRRDDLHAAETRLRALPLVRAVSGAPRGAADRSSRSKRRRSERPTRYGIAFVVRRADGAILLRRRPPRGLLGGMSEVPGTGMARGP